MPGEWTLRPRGDAVPDRAESLRPVLPVRGFHGRVPSSEHAADLPGLGTPCRASTSLRSGAAEPPKFLRSGSRGVGRMSDSP
jgi:hypothetical protein